jgi:2'-5' RNA ligase
MTSRDYALVAYVSNPIGQFVESLRREFHPEHPHLPAHLTLLPPRPLTGTLPEAVEMIEHVCGAVQPFEVTMGDVESFAPVTPTVFIRVAHAAYRMRELHEQLNVGALKFQEPWPYMPHLTVFRLDDFALARQGFDAAAQRWAQYHGPRRILIDSVTFVREVSKHQWEDLVPIPLGRRLAPEPLAR